MTEYLYDKFLNEWSNQWFQYILDNPNERWDWYGLSKNPNITWDVIINNFNKPWNMYAICMNPNLTRQIINDNWEHFILNGIVMQNEKYIFNEVKYIYTNKNLPFKLIEEAYHSVDNNHYTMLQFLSKNPNIISYGLLEKNVNDDWDWKELSLNPYITFDFVKKHIKKPWNYKYLSLNQNITLKIIEENPDIFNNYEWISGNPNLTWEFVKKNINKKWNWSWLSRHHNIDWNIIKNNLDKPWDFREMCINPNITIEMIRENKSLFQYENLYIDKSHIINHNLNINWDIVDYNIKNIQWNPYLLSNNLMLTERKKYITKRFQEWFVKSELKKEYIEKMWHPSKMNKWKDWGYDIIEDDDFC